MGVAFSNDDDNFNLKIINCIKEQIFNSVEELFSALQAYREKIQEKIEKLEKMSFSNVEGCVDVDRKIAILLRQDQYLEVLQSKQKSEIAEIFFGDNNYFVPPVLQWYNSES